MIDIRISDATQSNFFLNCCGTCNLCTIRHSFEQHGTVSCLVVPVNVLAALQDVD